MDRNIIIFFVFGILIFSLTLADSEIYSDCTVYGNCKSPTTAASVNYSQVNVNNSQYLGGIPGSGYIRTDGSSTTTASIPFAQGLHTTQPIYFNSNAIWDIIYPRLDFDSGTGVFEIYAGTGLLAGDRGNTAQIRGGDSNPVGAGEGGDAEVIGGNSDNDKGGDVYLIAGDGATTDGDIYLRTSTAGADNGQIYLESNTNATGKNITADYFKGNALSFNPANKWTGDALQNTFGFINDDQFIITANAGSGVKLKSYNAITGYEIIALDTTNLVPMGASSDLGIDDAGGYGISYWRNLYLSGQLISNKATGTAPMTIASTTKVTNLNCDLLDGLDSSTFVASSNIWTNDSNYVYLKSTAPQNLNVSDVLYVNASKKEVQINNSLVISNNITVSKSMALGNALLDTRTILNAQQYYADTTGTIFGFRFSPTAISLPSAGSAAMYAIASYPTAYTSNRGYGSITAFYAQPLNYQTGGTMLSMVGYSTQSAFNAPANGTVNNIYNYFSESPSIPGIPANISIKNIYAYYANKMAGTNSTGKPSWFVNTTAWQFYSVGGNNFFGIGVTDFNKGNITNVNYMNVTGLMQLTPMTLPACTGLLNSTFGANATGVYGCNSTTWKFIF